MRTLILLAAAAGLLAACGQPANDTAAADKGDNPVVAAAPEGPGNEAIDTRPTSDEAAQAAAANSYTEGQARAAIESAGYTNVSALTKSDNGLWQGTATKDGQTLQVSVDFKGSVVSMTPSPTTPNAAPGAPSAPAR